MNEKMQQTIIWATGVIICLSLILGTIAWIFKENVPPILVAVPSSGFTLLAAIWQNKVPEIPVPTVELRDGEKDGET